MQLKMVGDQVARGLSAITQKFSQSVILETFFLGAFERFRKSLIMTLEIRMKPHNDVRHKMKTHDDVRDKMKAHNDFKDKYEGS